MELQTCGLQINRQRKELEAHGSSAFPCAGYAEEYMQGRKEIPWHWHNELEIIYVKSGELELKTPGKHLSLREGEGCILNSDLLHTADSQNPCELHSLVFHPLLISGNEDTILFKKYIRPLLQCSVFDVTILPKECIDEFKLAFEAYSQGYIGFEFVVREKLSHICLTLYQLYEKQIAENIEAPDQDSIRLRLMLTYIHLHYTEMIKLPQIAKAAAIGERECLRCFQRMIQVSPMQYVLKYRIEQGASLLLQHPNDSVTEIAEFCGFESSSNFTFQFRRYYRCTPREYRKSNL